MKFFYSAVVCSALFRSSRAITMSFQAEEESAKAKGHSDAANFNVPLDTDRGKSYEDDEPVDVIVKTKGGRTSGASLVLSMSAKVNTVIDKAGIMAVTMSKRDAEYIKQNPNIEAVERDFKMYALDDTAEHIHHVRKLTEDTPYGIPMVLEDMQFFKDLGTPSGSIKVCVADTGYGLGHEDLPTGDDVTGSDSSSNGSWDSDGHGHGTHCSGTVAGLGENNKGVIGVIPDNMDGKFQLVIGKALSDSGSGSNSGVLGAVQGCVDDGAKVISLSLGGGGYSSTTDEFYNNLYENEDILFVAAAGNGGSSSKLYPASYPALMSVAAIDSNKNKASFSQYNDQVEISAPGVAVKSSLPNDKYASWSGTSMATPHVAGVAGLLWAYFPECKNYQIRNVLLATAEDLGDGGCDVNYGHGLVQAKTAYELLAQGNCGGNLGKVYPAKGGCEQSVPDGPTAAPTPECTTDIDCDDGDACTADTCENGLCLSSPNCASCGKSKVDVEITIDNYGDETAYDIKDSSGNKVMEGSGWPSNSVNSFWKCVGAGSYTFTITDAYGDGICCTYGNGGYVVKVNDEEKASGGDFDSSESKTFQVGDASPITPAPISPTPGPSTSAPQPSTDGTPTASSTAEPNPEPSTTGSSAPNPPTVPTPGPSNVAPSPVMTPPTMFPTHTPPTMYPTGTAPTPYPTGTPPTLNPTTGCAAKGQTCNNHSDCCMKKCNKKKKFCKK